MPNTPCACANKRFLWSRERDLYPRHSWLELTCDGDHGLLPPTKQKFEHPNSYVAQYQMAMEAGRKEQFKHGRRFSGPVQA